MSEKHDPSPQETDVHRDIDEPTRRLGEVAMTTTEAFDEDFRGYRILELDDPTKGMMLRRSYIRNTYRLFEKVQELKPDYALYLDKSGRPVSWLMKELYSDFLDEYKGVDNPIPRPETLFLNIDREHWRDVTGGKEYGSGIIGMDKVDQDVVDSLRTIFLEKEPEPGENVQNLPSRLDGKRILIVDEVMFTGDTLKIAKKLLETAFPQAMFDTHHWMISPKAVDKNAKSTDLPDVPVWYRQNAEWGRGVGNRNLSESSDSQSWRQRAGALFLSTRLKAPDIDSKILRKEINSLVEEYRKGNYGSVAY